jgi:hypothetical protein
MYRAPIIAAAIVAALPLASAANADVVNFSGSASGLGITGASSPDKCGSIPYQGSLNAPGSSNYGAITYTHDVCTSGSAGGPVFGTFKIFSGSDFFEGSLNGTVTVTGTPISDLFFTYLITGGTGQFSGASGSFYGIGTADLSKGPPATITLNFRAVPEPATWAMMLLGFAGIGLTIRRRQAPALRPA